MDTLIRLLKYIRTSLSEARNFKIKKTTFKAAWSQSSKLEKAILFFSLCLIAFTIILDFSVVYDKATYPTASKGGTYTEGVLGQPKFLNPILATTQNDKFINSLIYNGLYDFDKNGSITPKLATELPEISPDKLVYKVKLKHDVNWHSRTPFTADDILFTISAIKNPKNNSPLRNAWLSTDVKKVDDYTVEFQLPSPSIDFIYNLTTPIISQNAFRETDEDSFVNSSRNMEDAIGTGPYYISEVTEQKTQGKVTKISLKSYKSYFLGEPYISNIELQFFDNKARLTDSYKSKNLDSIILTNFDPENSEFNPAPNDFHQYSQVQALFFNTARLPDVKIRKLLKSQVNQDKLVQGELASRTQPIYNYFDLNQPGTITPQMTGTVGSGLSITYPDNPYWSEIASYIKNTWQQLGMTVNLVALDSTSIKQAIDSRNFDVLLYSYQSSRSSDPFPLWHSSQVTPPGINLTNLENSDIDKKILQVRSAADQTTKQALLTELNNVLLNESPAIPLSKASFVYLTRGIKNQELGKPVELSDRARFITEWYKVEHRSLKNPFN